MKKALILLILASVLGTFAGGLFSPVSAVFVQKIGGDMLSIGWASTVYFIAIGIFIAIFGKIADRIGKKALLIAGFALITAVDIYSIFIRNVEMYFVGQIIFGIGLAMTNPSWNGLFSMMLEKGRESSHWSIWECITSFGIGFAAIAGAFAANAFGFAYLFGLKAVLHSGSIIAILFVEETK